MILWTIQTRDVYNQLIKNGEYYCDINKSQYSKDVSDWPEIKEDYQRAYNFIIDQMKKRIGNPPHKQIKLPIWAYYTNEDGLNKRLDLRKHKNFTIKPYVMMEIELDDNQVLLSDFDYYTVCVLGNSPIYTCYNDYEYDCVDEWYESLNEEEKEKFKHKSWEDIFNLNPDPLDVDNFMGRGINSNRIIQATFWILKKENIRKVWYYN